MALGAHTAGAWAYAASGSVTITIPTHSAGDMLIAKVVFKSSAIATCAASTATSGWAKVGEYHGGTTNSGNGTGSVGIAVFWKVAASGSEPSVVVDFSQTVTQVGHLCNAYTKGASDTWYTPVGDGGPHASGTSISSTIQSHVAVAAGDLVDITIGSADDTALTVPTITQTGITFAAVVEYPATAGLDASGADGSYDSAYRIANTGTSSAAAVVTGTLAATEAGATFQTRLRAGPQTLPAAGNAAATGSTPAAAGTIAAASTTASLTGTAFNTTIIIFPAWGDWSETFSNATSADANVDAGLATGTGSALAVAVKDEPAIAVAAATGAANTAGPSVKPAVGLATGTGASPAVTATGAHPAATATASGSAAVAVAEVKPGLATGTGTGTAYDATTTTASATNAAAGNAAGTGVANDAGTSVKADTGLATGTGNAYDATTTTASATNAAAGLATGAGVAADTTITSGSSTVNADAGLASGTGTANNATRDVSSDVQTVGGRRWPLEMTWRESRTDAVAGCATGTGSARNPTITIIRDDDLVFILAA